jgi:hypothetical protein
MMARRCGRLSLVALLLYGGAGLTRAAPPPQDVSGILGQESSSDFAQVLAPRAFSFPADHGPHPLYRQEWWYLTGNLDAKDGERFGFELTFFRYALRPPAAEAPASASAWRARLHGAPGRHRCGARALPFRREALPRCARAGRRTGESAAGVDR